MSPLDSGIFAGAQGRFQRFEKIFLALDQLGHYINSVLSSEDMRIRDGREQDLSLLVVASLGKGLKTFQAISNLCLLGRGEGALVLLRSNVNLLINLAYIRSADEPVDRADDFLAYSFSERLKYLKIGHGIARAPWGALRISEEEVQMRAKRWKDVSLSDKAKAVPPFHYDQGYRIYSSYEHSDAFALNDYIESWDRTGVTIQSGESDQHVGLALVHSFGAMADLLLLVCGYFNIRRPENEKWVRDTWPTLSPGHLGG